MPHRLTLIYIGESIFGHPIVPSQLKRALSKKGLEPLQEFRFLELEPNLALRLKKLLKTQKSDTLIAATPDGFTLATQIISSMIGTNLVNRKGMLIPASAKELETNSYICQVNGYRVNVMRVVPWEKLPSLLLKPASRYIYHLFTQEEELPLDLGTIDPIHEAKRSTLPKTLQKFAASEVNRLKIISILPGWYRLEFHEQNGIESFGASWDKWRARMIPGDSLVGSLIRYFYASGKKITFAESCTGGRIAAAFTAEAGASNILEGSYVTYANRIKSEWLGVSKETLKRYGAVSKECVLEMASGARARLGADISLAVSGIAGPTGAVEGKPVGTVYICLQDESASHTVRLQLSGDRNAIQEQSLLYSLYLIVRNENRKIFDFFAKDS